MWLEKTEFARAENAIDSVVCTAKVRTLNAFDFKGETPRKKKIKVVIVVHTKMCIAQWIRLEAKCWLVMFGQAMKT